MESRMVVASGCGVGGDVGQKGTMSNQKKN